MSPGLQCETGIVSEVNTRATAEQAEQTEIETTIDITGAGERTLPRDGKETETENVTEIKMSENVGSRQTVHVAETGIGVVVGVFTETGIKKGRVRGQERVVERMVAETSTE